MGRRARRALGASYAYKILLAMAATVLVAVGAVALVVNRSVGSEFESYLSMGAQKQLEALPPILESYYQETGSWEGVESVWVSPGGGGGGRTLGSAGVVLVDAGGDLDYDPSRQQYGAHYARADLGAAQPLQVDGETVGYLLVDGGERGQAFVDAIRKSLVAAAAAASLVALLAGLLIARAVVRPIRMLQDTAGQIALGDLSSRAEVASRDEIGELAQRFNEMAATLERDEHMRQRMMADVAHELRTPLSVIRAQVEALQDGVFPLSEDGLEPIHAQTVQLGRLIDDLRDLALADAGRLRLESTRFDLADSLRREARSFASQAVTRDIMLEIDLDQPLWVCGDAQRLRQVLANLLSNAMRYCGAGGKVIVRGLRQAGQVGFAVVDDGPGIPADELARIFDRFYRVAKARNRADGGSGLGLAIAYQLVQAHGGELTVESVEGAGATFCVMLPEADDGNLAVA